MKTTLEESKQTAPLGATGFTDAFGKTYQEAAAKFYKSLPPELRGAYQPRLTEFSTELGSDATTFQRGARKHYYGTRVDDNLTTFANDVSLDPSRFEDRLAEGYRLIDATPDDVFTAIDKDEGKRSFRKQAQLAAIGAMDPETRIQVLGGDDPSQGAATTTASGSLVDRIIGVERGSRADAKNPNSSATGDGQFTAGTWLAQLRAHRPDLLEKGLSRDELLDLRKDPDLSREMTGHLAADNTAALRAAGVPVRDGTVYLAHFAGDGGAVKLLKADPSASAESVLGPSVINANPFLRGKTAGDVIAWADQKMGGSASVSTGPDLPIVSAGAGGRPGGNPDLGRVQPQLLTLFKHLQNDWGKSIPIVSGYRDPERNVAAGGADQSQHLDGNALDLDTHDLSNEEKVTLIQKASALGFRGIGVYAHNIHLDLGSRRAWGPSHHKESVPSWAKGAIAAHMAGTNAPAADATAGGQTVMAGGADAPARSIDPRFADLDFVTRNQLIEGANSDLKQVAIETRALIDIAAQNAPVAVQNTGQYSGTLPTAEQFMAGYGPQEGAQRYNEFKAAMEVSRQAFDFKAMPTGEILAAVNEAAPVSSGDNAVLETKRYQALSTAAKATIEAREADPAAYVQRQPSVAKAYEAMVSTPEDATAAQVYAATTLAEQDRLGVPKPAQRVLSAPQAHAVAQQFADPQTGAQNAAAMMRGLEGQWGRQWPRVFGELAQTKALPGTALVVGAMNRPDQSRAAEALAEAARIGTTELEKTVPPTAKKTVSDAIDASMEAFGQTLVNNGSSGVATFNTFREGVYQLALSYARSEEPSAAAARAVKDVIERKYAIRDTYRVPVEFNADEVADKAESIVSRLTGDGLVLPVSGLDEAQTRAAYLRQLQANAYWVTSGDESGLTLFDETGTAVVKQDGSPLTFTWQQILGQANRVVQSAPPEKAPMLAPPQAQPDPSTFFTPSPGSFGGGVGNLDIAPAPSANLPDVGKPTPQNRLQERRKELFDTAPELETSFGGAM